MTLSSWRLSVCCVLCVVVVAVGQEIPLPYINLKRSPDTAWTVSGGITNALVEVSPHMWSNAVARVETPATPAGLPVRVRAPGVALETVILRWIGGMPESTKLLGDTWERSYGDLA